MVVSRPSDTVQPSGSVLRGDPFAGLQASYDELQKSAAYFTQHSLSTVSPLQGGLDVRADVLLAHLVMEPRRQHHPGGAAQQFLRLLDWRSGRRGRRCTI